MGNELNPAISQKVIDYKRHIHANPEPGWQETATTAYIKEHLDAVSIIEGLGENHTGAAFVVGKGKTSIFCRADIDALKTSDGPKHLCGHSTHTAALMGAYHWLKGNESRLNAGGKSVSFIFQPAEEVHPSGARTFLDTYPRLLDNSVYGFGIHVFPQLPLNTVQIQGGNIFAANDPVRVEITGLTAHVKDTPKGIDAIDGAAQVVRRIRDFQHEFDNFGREIVFNLNTIHGGAANNSVADSVVLTGSIRWVNRSDQLRVKKFLEELPGTMKKSFPGTVSVAHLEEKPPPCSNNAKLADEIADYMQTHSDFGVLKNGAISLGVEDFAWFSRQYQTLYSLVGVESHFDLHHPQMEVSDEATLSVYKYWQNLLEWWIEK